MEKSAASQETLKMKCLSKRVPPNDRFMAINIIHGACGLWLERDLKLL